MNHQEASNKIQMLIEYTYITLLSFRSYRKRLLDWLIEEETRTMDFGEMKESEIRKIYGVEEQEIVDKIGRIIRSLGEMARLFDVTYNEEEEQYEYRSKKDIVKGLLLLDTVAEHLNSHEIMFLDTLESEEAKEYQELNINDARRLIETVIEDIADFTAFCEVNLGVDLDWERKKQDD